MGRSIEALAPDVIVLVTPHNVSLSHDWALLGNHSAAGTAEWDGAWTDFQVAITLEPTITSKLCEDLNSGLQRVQTVTSFASASAAPLRWGEVVPLHFVPQATLQRARFLVLCPPTRRHAPSTAWIDECAAIGARTGRYLHRQPQRVVFLISGDTAHTHAHTLVDQPQPYAAHTSAAPFDDCILNWIRAEGRYPADHVGPIEWLLRAADLAGSALSCGLSGFAVLAGALRELAASPEAAVRIVPELLCYEHPTYYGMVCADFHIHPLTKTPKMTSEWLIEALTLLTDESSSYETVDHSYLKCCIVVCGGGGKTTLSKLHPDLFSDIDNYWLPAARPEQHLLNLWAQHSGDWSLVRACEMLKAHRMLRSTTCSAMPLAKKQSEQGPPTAQLTAERCVLVQTPDQAALFPDTPTIVLVPNPAWHEAALIARGDGDWVREVCRAQRAQGAMDPRAEVFGSWEELSLRACAFAKLGV
jgi:aromatic ring-opening dioxygenase LigB subunit